MTTTLNPNDRLLPLEGACNVRDIGGYETMDGRRVQRGRFLRADGLHRLTSSDQETILAYGIGTAVSYTHLTLPTILRV